MRCNRCGGKIKPRKDGWRRCGQSCTAYMGLEMRARINGANIAPLVEEVTEQREPQVRQRRLPVTWRASQCES